MPKISVIVPLYNKEKFIADTIYCLRAQTFDDFECIIVDDFSTDKGVFKAFVAIRGDSRFRIVRNKINVKLPGARNIGLLHASGEYILFLDADDMISPTCLEERYKVAMHGAAKHVAGSYSKHMAIEQDIHRPPLSQPASQTVISYDSVLGESPFVIHQVLVRRDIVLGICGFDERFIYGAEDFEFWTRLLRHGFIFIPTKNLNAYYRNTMRSMVRIECKNHLNYALKVYTKNISEVKKNIFFSIANMKMYKQVYFYAIERNYYTRIFKFIGMQIANNFDVETSDLVDYIPDFFQGFPFSISPQYLINSGIRRVNPEIFRNDELKKKYETRAKQYVIELIRKTKENASDFNSNEEVETYSAEWQRNIDIIFIPHKDYHTETIKDMENTLKNYGISYVIADCSALFGDEGVRAVLQKYDMPHVSFAQISMGDFAPRCVIVFNDWEETCTKPAIKAAKKAGIIGLGIVEGIQDYNDDDTGKDRNAYGTCTHVITPCSYDMKYFVNRKQQVFEGSIPRIVRLADEAIYHPYSIEAPIIINSNFSYGVLADKRDSWIADAVRACEELGREYAISQHPRDSCHFIDYVVTKKSMYEAIWEGSLFISRFSSGIIESLAMGRPVIYFNPHHEKVDKFKDPMGAYYIAESREELKSIILKTFENLEQLKKNWPTFLERHAGYSSGEPQKAIERVCGIIRNILQNTEFPAWKDRKKFGEYLAAHFHKSDDELFQHILPFHYPEKGNGSSSKKGNEPDYREILCKIIGRRGLI